MSTSTTIALLAGVAVVGGVGFFIYRSRQRAASSAAAAATVKPTKSNPWVALGQALGGTINQVSQNPGLSQAAVAAI